MPKPSSFPQNNNKDSGSNSNSGNSRGNSSGSSSSARNPKIISGWEHSYAHHNPERYAYIGKEDGEPQWIDWGSKSSRNSNTNGSDCASKSDDSDDLNSESNDSEPEVKIISGWEHSYAHHNPERYAYLGKEDGEPQWVDWGSKGSRKKV